MISFLRKISFIGIIFILIGNFSLQAMAYNNNHHDVCTECQENQELEICRNVKTDKVNNTPPFFDSSNLQTHVDGIETVQRYFIFNANNSTHKCISHSELARSHL